MSYHYDPDMRRYVLNNSYAAESPSAKLNVSVASDTPKSTKSPNIIRVTSKSKMVSKD